MPILEIIKSYKNGLVLDEDMLDDVKTSVESFFNDAVIDADNIQDGSITSDLLASTSVDSDELGTGSIVTAGINDAAVTVAKLSSLSISSGSSVTTTATTKGLDIGTATVRSETSITTSGGKVMLRLVGSSSSNPGWVGFEDLAATSWPSASGFSLWVAFCRDGTNVAVQKVVLVSADSTAQDTLGRFPPSAFSFVDSPAAGTYTYGFRVAVTLWDGGGTVAEVDESTFFDAGEDYSTVGLEAEIENVKLSAYEL